jgi:hypothetical protein
MMVTKNQESFWKFDKEELEMLLAEIKYNI